MIDLTSIGDVGIGKSFACTTEFLSSLEISAMVAPAYNAVIRQDGEWWIGWIEEIPGVNSQGATDLTPSCCTSGNERITRI